MSNPRPRANLWALVRTPKVEGLPWGEIEWEVGECAETGRLTEMRLEVGNVKSMEGEAADVEGCCLGKSLE